ncbi:MAG: Oligopeptide transporter, family [Cyanobacteria bacterium RYN_339]|nr:Oligopeptide transporter, family [Cyanobacteria bacterium RYN_339]
MSIAQDFTPESEVPKPRPELNFNHKLPVDSDDPDAIERYWLENVYAGDDSKQLTWRSAIIGMVIGGVMSLSNLYVGLKTGWGMGVTITATVLAFSLFKALQFLASAKIFDALPKRLLGGLRDEFSILENNAMQSAASAAGYMATAGLISSVPALMMTTGQRLTSVQLGAWIGALSMLGVIMAIPMKRNMINIEQLRFPSGIATATTLKSMHAKGGESIAQAKALGLAGLVGAVVAWLRDGTVSWMKGFNLPPTLDPSGQIMGTPLTALTIQGESSLLLLGAGAIMGMRVALSMLVGGIAYFCFLAPWLIAHGIIPKTGGYKDLVKWSMWPGASIMLTSGLLSFFLQWKTLVRAFSGLTAIFKPKATVGAADPLDRLEVPGSWFLWSFIVLGIVCVALEYSFFQIPIWMGVLSVLLSFLLAIVASRATGETDITPISAMGQMTQLTFGAISPGNLSTNLMTAGATAGISTHTADLLTDLKSGYLLGAKPRQQFFAQFLGILAGSVFCVPAFNLLVPNVAAIGTQQFPAPSAQVYAGVAKLLSQGFTALPPTAVTAMVWLGIVGIVLGLIEHFFPKSANWLPSPVGLGIALVVPFSNSLMMFLGALIAWIFVKVNADASDRYIVPVASGVIAGESLMGIITALLTVTGFIQ